MGSPEAEALGARCSECPLKKETPVFAAKPTKPLKLVIVGEGPGRHEVAQGKPFVGMSGILLDQTLKQAGIDRATAHVTNAALCAGGTDRENEVAARCCAPRLLRELADLPADVPVVTLGKAALKSVLGQSAILRCRGFIWRAPDVSKSLAAAETTLRRAEKKQKVTPAMTARVESLRARQALAGRVVMPTVHPAFVLRADAWRSIFEIDARRVGRWLRGELTWAKLDSNIDGRWWYGDDVEELTQRISRMGDAVSVDIETAPADGMSRKDGLAAMVAKIICVGVGDGHTAVVIDPWVPELHVPLLQALLEHRRVVYHNGVGYDMIALSRAGYTATSWEDTLVAHHTFASHFPQSLAHVASSYTDAVPWKNDFRKGDGMEEKGGGMPDKMPRETRAHYCAIDVTLTALSWLRMQDDLRAEAAVYELDKQRAMMCLDMQVAGIAVDARARRKLIRRLTRRAAYFKRVMGEQLKWPDFNPRSPQYMKRALYDLLHAEVDGALKFTEKGNLATNEKVLESLSTRGGKIGRFARRVMTYRLVEKVRATYCQNLPVYEDGRAHYSWKAHGARTGRLACRLQSCPRYLSLPEQRPRELYIASGGARGARLVMQVHDAAAFEVGDELVYFDASQAEARVAACLSDDAALLEAVRVDIHLANAQVIFAGIGDAAMRLARGNELSPHVDAKGKPLKWKAVERRLGGCKEERDLAKNVGFCVWYLGGYERLHEFLHSKGLQVSLRACQAFVDRLHDRYWRYYQYVDRNLAYVREYGYIRTAVVGRFIWLGYYPAITDVANYGVQSCIADVMDMRLLELIPCVAPMTKSEDVKSAIAEVWARPVKIRKGILTSADRELMLPVEIKQGERWSEL